MGKKYLFVDDLVGSGPRLLPKLMAAEQLAGHAQWVFGGGYLDGYQNNLLTINMVCNAIRSKHAIALWGPHELDYLHFLNGESNDWLYYGGMRTVRELLGTVNVQNIDTIRSFMNNEGMIQWLMRHLENLYVTPKIIFAHAGVWLIPDFIKTPRQFAVSARSDYWWSPGGHQFAHNLTGRMVVTAGCDTSQIYGSYFDNPDKIVRGPEDGKSFGVSYEQEPPRLFLGVRWHFDRDLATSLPPVYIIDDDQGLIGVI